LLQPDQAAPVNARVKRCASDVVEAVAEEISKWRCDDLPQWVSTPRGPNQSGPKLWRGDPGERAPLRIASIVAASRYASNTNLSSSQQRSMEMLGWLIPACMVAMIVILAVTLTRL